MYKECSLCSLVQVNKDAADDNSNDNEKEYYDRRGNICIKDVNY